MEIFQTERLKIRQFVKGDYQDYSRLDSNPEVMRYIGKIRNHQEMTDRFHKILEYYKEFSEFGIWALVGSNDDNFHGWVCLKHLDSSEEIEVGYRLMHNSWGNGFATEASFGLLDYGFRELGLGRIVAVTIQENQSSQNVLRKIGMKFEKMANFYNTDVLYFGLNRIDYLNKKTKF